MLATLAEGRWFESKLIAVTPIANFPQKKQQFKRSYSHTCREIGIFSFITAPPADKIELENARNTKISTHTDSCVSVGLSLHTYRAPAALGHSPLWCENEELYKYNNSMP